MRLNRREFGRGLIAGWAAASLARGAMRRQEHAFRLRYIVASSMYGKMRLADLLPEVRKAGAEYIDIWPEQHANHREQIQAIGYERFTEMLGQHRLKLGILTRYDLGPFGLEDEIRLAKRLGGSMVISGSRGPGNLKGTALKSAVNNFVEKMKPHVAAAEKMSVTIGIENHANSLMASVDALRWFAESVPSDLLGIALAPYHLPQESASIAALIEAIGGRLVHFYAWQYGMGCHKKLPKQQELLQLPGRGEMSFVPIVDALKRINYSGWTEVFMHPVPRGIPILPTAPEVTAQINLARNYLERCLSTEPDAM